MTTSDELRDALREILGREQADELACRLMDDVSKTRALEGLLDSRRRDSLRECTSAMEIHGGVPAELLDAFGKDGLRLVARVARDSASPEVFRETLHLVELAIQEGRVMGARRVLERMLERSFGPLTYKCSLALETADVHDLNACFERLATAGSAEEVLDPILAKLLD